MQRLRTEDFVWTIYFFIALAAIISDKYEKEFVLTNNSSSKKIFKTINIAVLSVAFFIYLYFLLVNYEDVKNLRINATKKEVITSHLAVVASILFLVGGIATLFVEINRGTENEDVGII
ncbi:MAG: hypothetical protein E7163_01570 [Firmicutes bacterium]|nr:hypothetical protein [Bacillota bacterium]